MAFDSTSNKKRKSPEDKALLRERQLKAIVDTSLGHFLLEPGVEKQSRVWCNICNKWINLHTNAIFYSWLQSYSQPLAIVVVPWGQAGWLGANSSVDLNFANIAQRLAKWLQVAQL